MILEVLLLVGDIVKQFSSPAELHDQEEVLGGLDDLVKLNEMGMANQLQDVDLSRHSFDVRNVDNFLLFEDFDGDLLSSSLVNSQFDLPKGALPQCLL